MGAAKKPRSRGLLVGSLILGPGLFSYTFFTATRTGEDLRDAPQVPAVDTKYRKNKSSAPIIEVEGERHTCTGGGGSGFTQKGDLVAYDPDDPSNCRLVAAIGKMTFDEKASVGFAAAFLVLIVGYGIVQPRR